MPGRFSTFFRDDHRRLGELLERSAADPSSIDPLTYSLFRVGLLFCLEFGINPRLFFSERLCRRFRFDSLFYFFTPFPFRGEYLWVITSKVSIDKQLFEQVMEKLK